MMNTGTTRMGYPCVGSWVNYGLGSENDSLPSFVVMSDPLNRGLPKGSAANWGPGFLPSVYQGTWLKPSGAPIDNLAVPASLTPLRQRAQLELHATILAAAGLDHERLVDQAVNPASLCQVMAFSSMATSVTCSGLAMRLVSASGS